MLVTGRGAKFLTILNVLALAVIFGYATKDFIVPSIGEALYRDEYKDLVFTCDNVMREHYIAKNAFLASPSPRAVANLHSSEVGLLACHDYDVLRKRLIGLGVTENQLAKIGLEAIEERAKDVRSFVETHEIRY